MLYLLFPAVVICLISWKFYKLYIVHLNCKFRWAVEQGNTDEVKRLIKNKNITDQKYFIVVAENGYVDIVKLLLQHPRFDPTVHHSQSMRLAIKNNHIDIVRLLLKDRRCHPTDCVVFDGWLNALDVACSVGNLEIVKLLLEDGRTNPNRHGASCLRIASQKGYDDIVKLLSSDSRIDFEDTIHTAICENKPFVVTKLKDLMQNLTRTKCLSN